MDYIFIDESGELGKQTNHFVFGAIIIDDPKKLDKIIKSTRNKYKKQLGNVPEIKGYTTNNYVIKKTLMKLNTTNCKVVGIIFDKKNICKINAPDYNLLYDTLASYLADEIEINNSTLIVIDKCKNKEEEMINFNNTFISNLNNSKNYPIHIKHANSMNYKGLQMADLISWSIFQCVEKITLNSLI
ncbi:DUF3800 domain-containing protein [Methanobrevibacter sp.]|uniref:DUF3800 domain-containing protein n=1 Tax=Methanobrevibacter sp. TaxID=66852 RepID=UPI00388EC184